MMGTYFSVKLYSGPEACVEMRNIEKAASLAFDAATKVEQAMSEHRPNSAVSMVNKNAGIAPVQVDEMTWEVISKAHKFGLETGGAFDITFLPLGRLWNYKAEKPSVPSDNEIEEARQLVGLENLILDPARRTVFLQKKGAGIGLGGIAKGYALDRMAAVLEREGIVNFIVQGGGEMLVAGSKGNAPWKVGIQHPRKKGELTGKFSVRGRWAIATSGDYERYFMVDGIRYHHILNTKTGMPTRGIVSATVITHSSIFSDGLATALMVLGVEGSKELATRIGPFRALLIDEKMNLHRIGQFPEIEFSPAWTGGR